MDRKADEKRDTGEELESARGRMPLGRLKTFDSFKTPAYRVYYASMAGNWAAMSMLMIVRSLLIYRLTDSAAIIGITALANALPALLVALLGGAVADRIQKKYILFAGRVGSVVSALGIALALTLGYLSPEHAGSWWLVIASAALDGAVSGFLQPSLMAIIPELVSPERVMNAISLSSMGQTVFRLAGPTLAGFLVDAYGFSVVYYFMASMNTISAIGTLFLPRTGARTTSGGSTLRDMLEGLRYIRRETIFLLITIFGLCHMIGGMPYQQLLPVFTESILKVSATKMGLLNSFSAVGALLFSLVLASLPSKKRGAILLLSGVIMGLAVIVFAYSHSWYLSLSMMLFTGVGPTMHWTLTATLIQSYAAPGYRARMQSFAAMTSGLAGFGTFFAGLLSEAIGVQWAVGGMAIFLTLISVMFWAFSPRLRKLD